MFLDNQKYCVHRELSIMETICLFPGDLVSACSQCYLHLWKNNCPPKTPIYTYYVLMGAEPKFVTGTNIVEILRATDKQIGFQHLGFSPYEIGSHSLHLGGVMTLHQVHISDNTIKIIGRWRSDAFLVYLQVQVATFRKVVSKTMASVPWFTHQVPTPIPV